MTSPRNMLVQSYLCDFMSLIVFGVLVSTSRFNSIDDQQFVNRILSPLAVALSTDVGPWPSSGRFWAAGSCVN
jgi:hypothetical protein